MPAIKTLMDEVMSGPTIEGRSRRPTRRRVRSARPRKKANPLRRRSRHAKIHAEARRRAGSHGRTRRHDHGSLHHGERHPPRAKNRLRQRKPLSIPITLARLYAAKSIDIVELAARKVIAAVAEGDTLRTQMAILRRLAKHDPADTITLRREIAAHMVKAGKYSL